MVKMMMLRVVVMSVMRVAMYLAVLPPCVFQAALMACGRVLQWTRAGTERRLGQEGFIEVWVFTF